MFIVSESASWLADAKLTVNELGNLFDKLADANTEAHLHIDAELAEFRLGSFDSYAALTADNTVVMHEAYYLAYGKALGNNAATDRYICCTCCDKH